MGYEDVTRNLADNGAQVIIAPTLDMRSWGETQNVQHARMMPFRAVETGRWLVRAAASSTSMVVAPYGTVRSELAFGLEGHLDARVPLASDKTEYVRYGYLWPWLCQGAAVALLVVGFLRRRS